MPPSLSDICKGGMATHLPLAEGRPTDGGTLKITGTVRPHLPRHSKYTRSRGIETKWGVVKGEWSPICSLQREGPQTAELCTLVPNPAVTHNLKQRKTAKRYRQKPISHTQLLKPISDDGAREPQPRDHRWPMGGVDYDPCTGVLVLALFGVKTLQKLVLELRN